MTELSPNPVPGLSYRDAGVDIDAGARLVERIKPLAARTRRPGVLGTLGGFGALFELPLERYRRPVLVSGTDGVGTKLRLALESARHDTIGIDLVAMCVNDVVVAGAEPMYFLDYFATGRLNVDTAAAVIGGIAAGCELAGCALAGGETAEMPGMYSGDDYDLAGFCVGVVEHDRIIDGTAVRPGDVLLALASSGPHANGYSLIRRILSECGANPGDSFGDHTLADVLLAPTRIYVRSLLDLLGRVEVTALAHVTGGGLPENLPRVLPPGVAARIRTGSWQWPAIFRWLQTKGGVAEDEMYRTFNCGIGMVACVPADAAETALAALTTAGEIAWPVGEVIAAPGGPRVQLVP